MLNLMISYPCLSRKLFKSVFSIFYFGLFLFAFYTQAEEFKEASTGMEFVFIKGGCFEMGDTFGDGEADELPVHTVCLDDFYLGKFEVTQHQWITLMGNNPSAYKSGNEYPVEWISWQDAVAFIIDFHGVNIP